MELKQRIVLDRDCPNFAECECYVLNLLHPPFSVTALKSIGLTNREAEILFWISKDKSNAGIAKVLGCCEGTVRKHLEHLYKKLGVQTRMGAVMVALEKLGILKG
jgi:DNA-binding CsgD family transcriptional regulator